VLEYAARGNLFNYIKNTPDFEGKEAILLDMYVKICKAVGYMHSKRLLHRDIKPENILLDEHLNPKLCDFGWATELKGSECRKTFCGTYEYMAPEIFETESYDSAVDVWSLGILLYEILHRKSPFAGSSIFNIYKNIIKEQLNIRSDIDPLAASLVTRILKVNPKDRPTIEDILDDPFIQGISKRITIHHKSTSPCKRSFVSMSLSTGKFKDPALTAMTKKSRQVKHYSNNFDVQKVQKDCLRWNPLNRSARDILGVCGVKKERKHGNITKPIHVTGKNQSTLLFRKPEGLNSTHDDNRPHTKNRMYGSLSQNIPTSPLFGNDLSNNPSIHEEVSCSDSHSSSVSLSKQKLMSKLLSFPSSNNIVQCQPNDLSDSHASNPRFHANLTSNADLKDCLSPQTEINYATNPQNVSTLLFNSDAPSINNSNVRTPVENLTVSQTDFRKILKSKENLKNMSYCKTQSANLIAFKTLHSNKFQAFNARDLFSPQKGKQLDKNGSNIEARVIKFDKKSQLKQLSQEINKASFAKKSELIKIQNNRKAFSKSNFFKDFSILDKSQHNLTLKRLPSSFNQPEEPSHPVFTNLAERPQKPLPDKTGPFFTPNIAGNKTDFKTHNPGELSSLHSNRNLMKNFHNFTSKNFENPLIGQTGKKSQQYMSFIPSILHHQNDRGYKEKTRSPSKPLFTFDSSSKNKPPQYFTAKTNHLKSSVPNPLKQNHHEDGSFMKDHSLQRQSKEKPKRDRPMNSACSNGNNPLSGSDKYFSLKKQKTPEPSSINIVIKQCFHKTKVNYIVPDQRSFATPSFFSSFKSKNTSPKNENKHRNSRVRF
jgi:serine/threonine protein kinase